MSQAFKPRHRGVQRVLGDNTARCDFDGIFDPHHLAACARHSPTIYVSVARHKGPANFGPRQVVSQ